MGRNYIAIVLAGSTNGGKTSVTDRLIEEYPNSIRITQDDYFFEENHSNHIWIQLKANGIRHIDWERYGSIDWEKFDKKLTELHQQLNDNSKIDQIEGNSNNLTNLQNGDCSSDQILNQNLELIKKQIKLIIIEGHVLLNHKFPQFFKIDKEIFFTLSKEVCEARRNTRHYIPPDPPAYFEEIVWPSYLDHLSYAKANHQQATFINGELERETVFQKIKKEIDDVYLSLV